MKTGGIDFCKDCASCKTPCGKEENNIIKEEAPATLYNSRWIYVPFNDEYEIAFLTGNTYQIFIYSDEGTGSIDKQLAEYLCRLHNRKLDDVKNNR